jgi:hypothetical protein
MAWAVLMAGGSCPSLQVTDAAFLRSVAAMQPQKSATEGCYSMTSADAQLWYKETAGPLSLSLPDQSTYILYKVDSSPVKLREVKGQATIEGRGAFWLKKK